MDGRSPTGGSKQYDGPGGDHKGGLDVRRSSDEPEMPDPELLALMITGRDYLRLTEPRDDNDGGNRATGAESRSPPPPVHPPGATPASTAAPTPTGTPPASRHGQKKSPGTLSLFSRVRQSLSMPPGRSLTQEEIDDYWSSPPTPSYSPPKPPATSPSTNNDPESPNPTTLPGSGGISPSISLASRPTPPKTSDAEEQPKQEVSTPTFSHKRNKSHGDHINSAVHIRLPASPSPRPRPLSEGVAIPTPTRPPPPLPVNLPGSTINKDEGSTRLLSPDSRPLVVKVRPPGATSSRALRPLPYWSEYAKSGQEKRNVFRDLDGRVVERQRRQDVEDAEIEETKEIARGIQKTLEAVHESLTSIRMEDNEEGKGEESENDGKGKGKGVDKVEDEKKGEARLEN